MNFWQDLLKSYRNYRKIALLTILLSGALEILDLMVPYVTGQIINLLSYQPIDNILANLVNFLANVTNIPNNRVFSLGVLLGIICLVTVVRSPIQPWLTDWFHWEIALKVRREQLKNTVRKILTLPLSFYDEYNPGRITNRISKGVENQLWTYPEIAGQLIPKFIRVLGIFVIILLIDWKISVIFIISFTLILGFSIRSLNKILENEELLEKHSENTQSFSSELITNIKTVKSFATERRELERQDRRLDRELKYVLFRIHKGYVKLETWQKTFIQSSVFLILVYSLVVTVHGHISLGHFITLITVSSMAYAELDPITQLAEVFARRYSSMSRFHEFLHTPSGKDAAILTQESINHEPYQFTGKIHFDNLSFAYHENHCVLKDIELLIHPYETVAIVGKSGSGKSTLIKLLLRYFQPTQGKILMDGQDIKTLDMVQYRQRLAMVHQEVEIFNGTLLDNLTYGNRSVSFDAVEKACKISRVDEFIAQFPQGYYTIVGERGVRLSGGQRQRIGIARALIVEPDVLIFDEATSSLDYESERLIQLAMSSILGTRTTIIIAHRLSTVREADKIIVLDEGKIVEIGNHEQLLEHQGIYHRLHSLQETGELS
ncbi:MULTISPECIES: ABC transporter ATP-binding protein [Crocosphaera]|uniref:ABC transporter ATP-binding protein n=3 Tax=Crocosphaera watsonii TaxID=263511 RepID=T2JNL2_CROWT|nr:MULTISPECIES: ABC transporter ATP-binding protein [Crocosphaera]EHJ14288.1 ATP-binding protein of ABC transporter [Crocosphaera watsonii WH 0003]MCH2244027.1 ABC transporter ATP-binding protein/permease [Crocosphaera sp.]NQZ61606.1 ABC transporter ATP-binding protein [Crocosphaera sp.]CCQ54403.1 ABC transporter ATP-binding protein [Crocosphaera watsonii WH 0005]CCQ66825.1 ABC transporter ATP-binding protein [Crocosphaera watsonii WH 0402]